MFLFDDLPAIVNNPLLSPSSWDLQAVWEALFSHRSGPLYRPLSMLSFVFQEITGFDSPAAYRLGNLAIHLLNGLLLFFLTRRILGFSAGMDARIGLSESAGTGAAIVAGLWLLHPIHVSGVAFAVQRMTLLCGTFVLAGLLAYCTVRQRQLEGRCGMPALLTGFLPWLVPAVLCKENGALLPLFALLLECFVFRFTAPAPDGSRRLRLFHLMVAVLPALIAVVVFLSPSRIDAGYALRDFDLTERLLTQARVIWSYLTWLVWPDITSMALYHDDIPVSRSLFAPPTTLPAILGICALLLLVVLLRSRQRLIALGLGFFLAGHSMESTVIPLEIAYEHRNYLPSWGVFLALYTWLVPLFMVRRPAWIAGVAFLGLAAATALRASQWADLGRFHRHEAANHPGSMRAQMGLGEYYLALARRERPGDGERRRLLAQARERLERAVAVSRGSRPLALLMIGASRSEWPDDPRWRDTLSTRLLQGNYTTDKDQAMVLLLRCVIGGTCGQMRTWLGGTLEALVAAGNPTTRARLSYLAATYYVEAIGDHRRAITHLLTAVTLRPEQPLFRLALARQYLASGDRTLAAAQISVLERMAGSRSLRSEVQDLRRRLERKNTGGVSGKDSHVTAGRTL